MHLVSRLQARSRCLASLVVCVASFFLGWESCLMLWPGDSRAGNITKRFRPSFECIFNVCHLLEMKSKTARRIPGHFAEATMAATLCMKVPVSHITIFRSLSEVRQQYWHTKYSRRPFPKKEQKRKKNIFQLLLRDSKARQESPFHCTHDLTLSVRSQPS